MDILLSCRNAINSFEDLKGKAKQTGEPEVL